MGADGVAGPEDLSPRVARLRELALAWADELDPTERGRAVMRAYDRHASEPPGVRHAEAVAEYLRTKTLILSDGDLLAGRISRLMPGHPGIHEGHRWVHAAMYPELGWYRPKILADTPVSDEFREALREWQSRNRPAAAGLERPPEMQQAQATGAFMAGGLEGGHRLPRYQLILERGAAALRAEAEERLAAVEGTAPAAERTRALYRSIITVYRAMSDFGQRWSGTLQDLAETEQDDGRREELRRMATVCRRVPAQPARTFREAMQCVWSTVVTNVAECPGLATSLGRFDQYMLPFFRSDIAAGRLTREDARELIECLFLKFYRTFDFHHTMIGGITPAGDDGTNELSWLCLEAMERLRTPRDVAVRIHPGTPPEFLRKAVEVTALGLGRPDFWNDDVTVQALLDKGFPLEDARDYAVIGCVELTIPGKCNSRTMGHAMNLAKILELTLHGGRCPRTGHVVGREHTTDFQSYAELHAAFRDRVAYCVQLALEQNLRAYRYQAEHIPFPVLSACTEGCLESGRDVMDSGACYSPAGVNLFGIANAADGLAAIRKLVFEERAAPLPELRDALSSDFDGREDLRQMLLTRAPKFGNDDPSVDRIAAEETEFYCSEVAKVPTPEGGPHCPLIFGCTPQSVFGLGPLTGALPDGRRAGEPIATSCSPTHGRNLSGLTAELKSVSRLDYRAAAGGVSYIVDLHPCLVSGPAEIDRLTSALRTFFDEGGMEIGINVLHEDQLRAAQREPDKYGHIMVRVFGFSSQFVSLDKELQEHVIRNARHEA